MLGIMGIVACMTKWLIVIGICHDTCAFLDNWWMQQVQVIPSPKKSVAIEEQSRRRPAWAYLRHQFELSSWCVHGILMTSGGKCFKQPQENKRKRIIFAYIDIFVQHSSCARKLYSYLFIISIINSTWNCMHDHVLSTMCLYEKVRNPHVQQPGSPRMSLSGGIYSLCFTSQRHLLSPGSPGENTAVASPPDGTYRVTVYNVIYL